MSSMHERIQGWEPTDPVKDIKELPFGVYIPLSNIVEDLGRERTAPRASDIYRITRDIFSSFPDDARVSLRGSTWGYELLNLQGIERRATVSSIIISYLEKNLEYSHTASASGLRGLINGSDLDLFLPGSDLSAFSAFTDATIHKAEQTMGIPLVGRFITDQKREGVTSFWSKYRVERPRDIHKIERAGKTQVRIEVEKDTVSGIPYGEIVARTQEGQPLTTVFWTPGELDELGEIQDTRRDPHYALSWDIASSGELIRSLPPAIRQRATVIKRKGEESFTPQQKRMAHQDGVFTSLDYTTVSNDVWFHISQENIQMLSKPIEVGDRFADLSVVEQVRLGFRGARMATFGEENLKLTDEGRTALATKVAPAISDSALDAFKNISLEDFTKAFNKLDSESQGNLQEEIRQQMLLGLFYGRRFISYCREAGLFNFFPNLSQLSTETWRDIIHVLPTQKEVDGRMQKASRFEETGYKSIIPREITLTPNTAWHYVESEENKGEFFNPYQQFASAIGTLAFSDAGRLSYLELLDELLALSPRVTFVKAENARPVQDMIFEEDVVNISDFEQEAKRYQFLRKVFHQGSLASAALATTALPSVLIASYIKQEPLSGEFAAAFLITAKSVGARLACHYLEEKARRREADEKKLIARIRGELTSLRQEK